MTTPMSTTRIGLLAVSSLLACSSSGGDTASLARARSDNTPPALQDRNACNLITEAEAEALLGTDLEVTPQGGSGPPACEYAQTGRQIDGFIITVYWRGGRAALETTKGAMTIATSPPMMCINRNPARGQ